MKKYFCLFLAIYLALFSGVPEFKTPVVQAAPVVQPRLETACPDPQNCHLVYLPVITTPNPKMCLVTDTGGVDDKSFNALAWKGLQDAHTMLGVEAKYLESQQQTDYEKNINAFVAEKCDLIVTVGYQLGDATKAAAVAHPAQKFTIVDVTYDPAFANVLGIDYATQEAAFLAGYLAAGTTKTGKVGTFGGLQIPPVTVFMDGFYYGVQYYNQQKSANVQVLGWDPADQTGLFTGNFYSTDDGMNMGNKLMNLGADVILPVAGVVGLGTAQVVLTRSNAWVIGVDSDWAITASQYQSVILTSVLKKTDQTVYQAAAKVVAHQFAGGRLTGTLKNDGVGLGTIATAVPQALLNEVETVKAGIIAGSILVP